ncbi:inner-membrane translocator [Streptomyces ambofaciens]|uniref:Inner-membrane translocator n=1 Tax=Streptomyces ambofaciens TaxID=1889 RepID=A0ABM6B6J2_STRAM|nr:hypothetical protein [Streptomyces ambofaciens]ANB09775.1 inner-membrane translocator [Streptomyces ambofaciens]
MPEPADERPSAGKDPLTAGLLLFLVLVADVGAVLLVAIVLAVRGLGRTDTIPGQTAAGAPPVDWGPVLGYGALALTVAITALLLLRIGHLVIGSVQLTLFAFLTVHALGSWP